MKQEFTKKQVETRFRKFDDYSNDLESSGHNTFDNNLDIFLNHCENDSVMAVITNQLKKSEVYDNWKDKFINNRGGMVGAGKLNLPIDEFERDSFLYQLLLKLQKKEVETISITMRCHGVNRLDDDVYWFNENFVRKLIRSLKHNLEEIEERISEEIQEGAKVPYTLLLVFQDNSIRIGSNVRIEGDAAIGKEAKIEKI